VLSALWRAHGNRFAADGRIDEAAAARIVVEALSGIEKGCLAAAHVINSVGEYLVWIDLAAGRVIIAFPNASDFTKLLA